MGDRLGEVVRRGGVERVRAAAGLALFLKLLTFVHNDKCTQLVNNNITFIINPSIVFWVSESAHSQGHQGDAVKVIPIAFSFYL